MFKCGYLFILCFIISIQFINNNCVNGGEKDRHDRPLSNSIKQSVPNNDIQKEKESDIMQLPDISFVNSSFDFGDIFRGENIEHVYKFKNKGKGNLRINKVSTSCGCTAAVIRSVNTSYKESGEIKINFNSKSDVGKVSKHVIVYSNDPDTPEYKLTIFGNVVEEVVVVPRKLNFTEILYGTGVTKNISIKSIVDPEFEISQIVSNNASIVTVLKPDKFKNGYLVEASLNKDAKLGRLNGKIIIHTNSKRMEKIEIPFYGKVVGDMSVYPPRISCGTVPIKVEKTVPVYATAHNKDVTINSANIKPGFLKAQFTKMQDKVETYKISITLKNDAPIGRFKGDLKIYTTSKNQPVIDVPVYGMVKEG